MMNKTKSRKFLIFFLLAVLFNCVLIGFMKIPETVKASSTFGYAQIGANEAYHTTNCISACRFPLSENAAVYKITAYITTYYNPPIGVRCMIYSDDAGEPRNLIATSSEVYVGADWGWFEFPISANLTAGVYHLAFFQQSTTTSYIGYRYDTGESGQTSMQTYGFSYPTPPNPFTRNYVYSRKCSIYASYTATGGGDTEPPTFGAITANSTAAGGVTRFTCTIYDNVAVSHYSIATNNTGRWVNSSWVAGSSASLTVTLNSTVGVKVGVQVQANDTSNNLGISAITYFTTIAFSNGTATAASGSPADIQAAVNAVVAHGGVGTVLIPEGNFTFDFTGSYGVYIPGGVNVIGAGADKTILTRTTQTAGSMFYIDGSNGLPTRISGIHFKGYVVNETIWISGILVFNATDFRIDHNKFTDFTDAGVNSLKDTGVHRGVIDNNVFDNPYKEQPGTWEWGYGVGLYLTPAGISTFGWKPLTYFLGKYDDNIVFIENNTFSRWRYAAASNTAAWYVFRYNTVTVSPLYGSFGKSGVDTHEGSPAYFGGRGLEAYNNTIMRGGDYGEQAFRLRGGSGVIYNNTVINVSTGVWLVKQDWATNETNYVKNMYIWSNTFQNVGEPISPYPFYQENVHYFLRAPNLAQDGFEYTSYPYPHPLTVTNYTLTIQSTTGGTVSPTVGVYSRAAGTNQTLIASPSSGYSFVNWTITFANTTTIQRTAPTTFVIVDQDITAKAFFTSDSTPPPLWNLAARAVWLMLPVIVLVSVILLFLRASEKAKLDINEIVVYCVAFIIAAVLLGMGITQFYGV